MRAHNDQRDQIEQRLRREKPVHSAPAGFTERVMSNLPDRTNSPASTESRPQQLLWPRLAITFALVAIAAVLLSEFFTQKPAQLSVANKTGNAANHAVSPEHSTSPAVFPPELPLPTITPEQLQALTTKLDDPLEKELNNVISDTRIAIQFVAANFIPEK